MAGGPLRGIRVVEFAGLGPTPFGGMLLTQLGADVVRIGRTGQKSSLLDPALELMEIGRPLLELDLKSPAARAQAMDIVASADVLLEGFRPGVMERLGLSPAACHTRNPKLVYARMTGWGQTGAESLKAGHDINYIARSGALWPIGAAGSPPPPPLNLVGDFGGGGMLVVVGILAALLEARVSGQGQVVDAAMVDGAALLTTHLHGWMQMGFWADARGQNLLDGTAYFYRCYETADGGYMAVGAIEPQFHAALIEGLGLPADQFTRQMDRRLWAERSAQLAEIFRTRTRAEWVAKFAALDACVTPVLTPTEAVRDPINAERGVFAISPGGVTQPSPAPRFSRTQGIIPGDAETGTAWDRLAAWGVTPTDHEATQPA